jgi:hypothetical protein
MLQPLEAIPYGRHISHLLRLDTSVPSSDEQPIWEPTHRLSSGPSSSTASGSLPWTYEPLKAKGSTPSFGSCSTPSLSRSPLAIGRSASASQTSLPQSRKAASPYTTKPRKKTTQARTLADAMAQALIEQPIVACLAFLSIGLNIGRLCKIFILARPAIFGENALASVGSPIVASIYSPHISDLCKMMATYPQVFGHWLGLQDCQSSTRKCKLSLLY